MLEQDIENYTYRRYQQGADVELPVADNPATAHTATYVAHVPKELRVAPVVITQYAHAEGLTDALRAQLRGMDGYTYGVKEVFGEHVWTLGGELGDRWLLWTHENLLVKLGVPEGDTEVPLAILDTYLDRYPSDLDAQGHADR